MGDREKHVSDSKVSINRRPSRISAHKAGAIGKQSTKLVNNKQKGCEEPKHKKRPAGRQGGCLDIKHSRKRRRKVESNRISYLLADGRRRCSRSDGRHWQCKDVAMDGRAMCETHYCQILERNKKRAEEALLFPKSTNDKQKIEHSEAEVSGEKKKRKILQSPKDSIIRPEPAKILSVREDKVLQTSNGGKHDLRRSNASKPLAVSSGVHRKKKVLKHRPQLVYGPSRVDKVRMGKLGAGIICDNASNGRSLRKIVLSPPTMPPGASLKQQHMNNNTMENSPVKRLLRKKNGQTGSGTFPKGAESKSASQLSVVKCIGLTSSKKLRHLRYLLAWILPYLKDINNEQKKELAVEDNLKGMNSSNVERLPVEANEQLACDNCGTSILDLHRRCSNCDFILCLGCCHELRKDLGLGLIGGGCLQVEDENLSGRTNTGGPLEQLAEEGAVNLQTFMGEDLETELYCNGQSLGTKVCQSGSILCLRGCESFFMQLRSIYRWKLLEKLEMEVESILGDQMSVKEEFGHCLVCQSKEDLTVERNNFRLAANRQGCNDNQLFCPRSSEMKDQGLEYFQNHWRNGEPIIVKDVLPVSSGLSWEPKHMCHSLRKMSKGQIKSKQSVVAIDALDRKEVEINLLQFFDGFERGCINQDGHPVILNLKDCPPIDSFKEHLSSYETMFIDLLPLHIYTYPKTVLNAASRFPMALLKPEVHAKTCIGYGIPKELEVDVAATLLHCEMCDMVNLLVHASEVTGPALICRRVQLESLDEEDCRYFSEKHPNSIPIKIVMDSVRPIPDIEVLRDNLDGGASFMSNKGKKSQLSSPSTTVSDLSLTSEKAALKTGVLLNISGGSNEESPDNSRLSLLAQVVKTSGDAMEEIVSKDQKLSAGTLSVTSNESGIKDEGTLQPEKSEESASRKQIMSVGVDSINIKVKSEISCTGTLWDVFRRQDVPKLKRYLIKHACDFDLNADDLKAKAVNPILEEKFYLSEMHKRKLKEEFQIEPWTFEQNLGEAIYVPAGCPYQVRNLKSCVNMALEFVSPESIHECVQLTNELRLLPWSHRAKEDKLKVKDMIVNTAISVVKFMNNVTAGQE